MERFWLKYYPSEVPYEINPDEFKNIHEILDVQTQRLKDTKVFTCMDVSITCNELNDLSNHFAAYLQQELGLKKGDHLAIMMPNTLQYIIAIFGALKAGLVVVNVNPLYTPRELIHQLTDSATQSILVLENFAHTVSDALPELNLKHVIIAKLGDMMHFPKRSIVNFVVKYVKKLVPKYHIKDAIPFRNTLQEGAKLKLQPVEVSGSDIAFLQYTGGTTGVSKGAILTHRNIVANVLQGNPFLKLFFGEENRSAILPLPLYHIYSLTVSIGFVFAGVETILITNPKDIPGFVKELKKHEYTFFVGLTTLFHALLNNKDFRNLKFSKGLITLSGGIACKESVAREWQQVTGSLVREGYGLTETSPGISISMPSIKTFTGTVGVPVPSMDVDIRDLDGNSLPIGQEGEICVKGPNVTQGYWKKPEESAKVFTRDGWFKTGDIGVLNEDGTLKILDRIKDMIIVGGFNVYPNEVEEILMQHEGVSEAAVVGEPDEHSGEIVKAFIVKKDPNLTEEEIQDHCKKLLTGYKRPHIIVFRNELPKSVVGKILRKELRHKNEGSKGEWLKAA